LTNTGEVIAGRRLMDSKERLVSLTKADLKEYTVEKEPRMPSYRDKLTDAERADLIAYLVTLKSPPNAGGGSGG